ncbi:MAG TPA: CmcJ/NvfI family oxidoreductase [Steroidobacteraceae bacterium]
MQLQAMHSRQPDRDRADDTVRRFSPAAPRPPGVTAALAYLVPGKVRPYNYMYEPPAGTARENCEYRATPVWISDARAMSSPPSMQVEGFELWDAPSSVTDFTDQEAIRSRYYAEASELAKYATGADHAYIFDHQVRQREAGRVPLTFGRHGDGTRPGAAGRIHNDYTETSGQRRFDILPLDAKVRATAQRFAIVNIWRSIGGKVVDTPLAVCDARSISVRDLVVADLYYRDRSGELYLVQESPRHRWAYFREMDCHEALIFKQYDSQVSGIARFTPHSAFDLPDIPSDAPLRRSIEIRCLVTYR